MSAQSIANYTSTYNTGIPYNSISLSGNAFNSWRNTGTFTQDDNRSDRANIGFDFWYDGVRYTQFCVSTNGFIDFSSSNANGGPTASAFGYDNTYFTNSASPTAPAIAPFYDDLTAQGGVNALGNSIKYSLSGTAPNRVLTIEWINMAVYGDTSPSLNFQVTLRESTGVISVNYGTMNPGAFTFSYSMGLNGPVLSFIPSAAQLKELQTVNTNTFSNTVQNNLSAMPPANSSYVFTPPVPTAVSGTLTFSGVGQSGMTLNWPDWASNEVGYVIYNSTDGINYSFVSQTAANATTTNITGLLPSTTYYWRVYAVTEGCLSSPLTGTQATTAAGNKISNSTGSWSNAAIWTPAGVPTAADNVTISNGNTVTIDMNAQCNSLTVGTGAAATLEFGTTTARTLTVNANVVINANATFNVNTASTVTHTFVTKGDITNNGTLNFATGANSLCNSSFVKDGHQSISGTGVTLKFNKMALSMGNTSGNILDITSNNFSAAVNFLTLNSGTFKLSAVNAVNITPFNAATTIPLTSGLWVNSANATVNTIGGITLYGTLAVSNGTLSVGNAADQDLLSSGGTLQVSGGLLNIAGKYYSIGINNLCYFSLSGGTAIMPSVGSTNTTIAPFQMTGAGSQFAMSGGSLIIPRAGGTGQNLGFVNTGASSGAVTGGTLQIGNTSTPASQTITINSSYPVGNLLVSSANATAMLATNTLSVINHVMLSSGVLNANNLDMSLGGNWQNNGGTFRPGTASVTLNSAGAQSIFKSGGETFNHLTFNGAGTKTFASPVNTNGNFTINSGSTVDVSTANYQLAVKSNFTNNGTFTPQKGLVLLNGTTAQTLGGSTTTSFYDLTLNNTTGASLSGGANLIGTLSLNNGVFTTTSQVFTLISTATGTGRIGPITGTGNLTGNITAQRFIPGGTTGWGLLGTPISSALTLADWNDDIPISCPSCPNGSAGGFLSVYTYSEAVGGAYDNPASYIPLSGITDPIIPGKGYWVYIGTSMGTTADITADVTGTPRKFNYTLPLSYTNTGSLLDDGWNLVCNPYPSAIRWSLLKGATANIDNAVYVYNADLNSGAGGYATYINGISSPAVGAGGVSDTIPQAQGFYVHSTGATGLNAQETNKVGGNPTFLKTTTTTQTAAANPMLRLHIDGASQYHDETVLYLQAGATKKFDVGYDAYKLRGQDPLAPTLALQDSTLFFQVNGVAPVSGNFSMPLQARTGYAGNYTIGADNISSFPQGACINLYDTYTGTTTNLKTGNYAFYLSDTTNAARFMLNITIDPLQVNSHVNQPTCALPQSGLATAVGANSGPWNYYWKDNTGAVVRTSLNKSTADTLTSMAGGTYTVEVNTVGMCDDNSTPLTINAMLVPVAQFSCADTLDLSAGALTVSNTSSNAALYAWDFGDGMGSSFAFAPSYNYTAPGIYTITLVSTSSTGCSDTSSRRIVVTNAYTGIQAYNSNQPSLVVKTIESNDYLVQQTFTGATSVECRLLDATGKLVITWPPLLQANSLNLPVNLKGYQPGIYFLEMVTDHTAKTVVKLPVR